MKLSKVKKKKKKKMASTLGVSELKINHRIKFRSLVGDHHM